MRTVHALVTSAALAVPSMAFGQGQVIASLPWLHGQTAGPNGTNYPPPDDARDLWVCEDMTLATGVNLTRFESWGTIFPTPLVVQDVTVRIYDDLPTVGNLILESAPGTGGVQVLGFENKIYASFNGAFLPAGSYWVVWNATTNAGQIAIYWAQAGPHSVGGGLPDNGMQWNPGGFYGYPNNIRFIPAQLGGGGQIGCNFTLFGTPAACYANCDNSTAQPVLNVQDFTCFLQRYAAGESYANCDESTAAPVLNVQDFTCFLQRYAAGCP
jgi:hypothetical protein